MKKHFLFITLWLSPLLLIAATPGLAAVEKTVVSVTVAEEEALSGYDSYHEFIEFEEKGYQRIIFHAAIPLKEFKFIEIINNDEGLPVKARALYSLNELKPDEPFVVTWMEWGSMPHRGIVFIDEDNETRCYFIAMSGDDGSLVLNEHPVACQDAPGRSDEVKLLLVQ